ncbi:TPA: hypothetical protein N0F65_012176 [Lagenidium giganteum]|uniref:RecA family profile 1 domain-containing protein n=1 Tax=Lagenidium giganteum TaxID=4803 RepID=A0AAV2ZIQ0_9STRA|nr:TPA: hypothetical protein N0F65_012176 [Lagenidium giganteum]
MLQRAQQQEQVTERRQRLLQASGIKHFRQLVQRPLWDVAHASDRSVDEATDLVRRLSLRLSPPSQTALTLFLDKLNHPVFLRTGLPLIDHAFSGGIVAGGITEFAGAAGIGKSQLAMTLAVACADQYPNASVLYFDLEGTFNARRAMQIARARHGGASQHALLERIRVMTCQSLNELLLRLKELNRGIHGRVKLIVVDSIAAVFTNTNLPVTQRFHQVQQIARELKESSDVLQTFAVVVNRATTVSSPEGVFTKPALGEEWAHCVTHRLILERHPMCRVMTVVKSSAVDHLVQPFLISERGVEPWEEDKERQQPDSIDFGIHDDLIEELAMTELPIVEPTSTLRSTQHSSTCGTSQQQDLEGDDVEELPNESTVEVEVENTAVVQLWERDDYVSDSNEETEEDDGS